MHRSEFKVTIFVDPWPPWAATARSRFPQQGGCREGPCQKPFLKRSQDERFAFRTSVGTWDLTSRHVASMYTTKLAMKGTQKFYPDERRCRALVSPTLETDR